MEEKKEEVQQKLEHCYYKSWAPIYFPEVLVQANDTSQYV